MFDLDALVAQHGGKIVLDYGAHDDYRGAIVEFPDWERGREFAAALPLEAEAERRDYLNLTVHVPWRLGHAEQSEASEAEPIAALARAFALCIPVREVQAIAQHLAHARQACDFRGLAEIAADLRDAADGLDQLDERIFGKRDTCEHQ